MDERQHNQRMSKLRRHVVWLAILGLYGLVFAPLSHVIGHDDDHVHTPDGGIVYTSGDAAGSTHRRNDHHAHHGHGDHHRGHGDHHHGHGDHHDKEVDTGPAHADHHHGPDDADATPSEKPGDPEHPSPLDHAADSFAHFSASVSAPSPHLDIPPATDLVAPVGVEPLTFDVLPIRAPRLDHASPRGPPELPG